MADEIALEFDTLRAHASKMRELAGDVHEAVSAVGSIDLAGGAFGVMCSFLVPPAQLVSIAAQNAIGGGGRMLTRTADEVVALAQDAEEGEQQRTQSFQELLKALG